MKKTVVKLAVALLAIILALVCVGCNGSNPFFDPYTPQEVVGLDGKPTEVPFYIESVYHSFDEVIHKQRLPIEIMGVWVQDQNTMSAVCYSVYFAPTEKNLDARMEFLLWTKEAGQFTQEEMNAIEIIYHPTPGTDVSDPQEKQTAQDIFAAAILVKDAQSSWTQAKGAVKQLMDEYDGGDELFHAYGDYEVSMWISSGGTCIFSIKKVSD